MGCKFQVNIVASRSVGKTPYIYSFNNPTCPPEPWRRRIAFADPSGADPDPDYQNPNHQYYFHNGNGSAGYPGLTYDDWVPQSTRGEYNNAYGWRTDFALGWFGGGGQSLNAGSFAYQNGLYYANQDRLHKAQAMDGAVTNALSGPDGETYMTVSGGRITSREFKSTLQLQREWGSEIARGYYGGDGRMPAGLSPANQFNGQVVGMLPQTQEGPDSKFYYDALDGMVLNNGSVLSRNDLALTFDKASGNATYLGFKNGKHHVNFDIEDFEITKGNVRALAIHEIFGHGIMGYGDKTNDHYKAYWTSIDSRYWSSTTDQYRTHTAEGLWLTWTRAGNYEGMPTKYMNVIYQYHPAFK